MEPIGFIGDNYQRFYIHFNSIVKKSDSPYEYLAYGKTKVKETICEFIGTIKIIEAKTYNEGDLPKYKQGFATCEVKLYEDDKESSSGVISGKLTTSFIIDDKQKFRYDALMFGADGFTNNEFNGSWTSYKTGISKKCNWGDYRIPECNWLNGCDIGAGEFSISDKYLKNGWENYKLAYSYDPDKPESQKARQKENEQWWKQKTGANERAAWQCGALWLKKQVVATKMETKLEDKIC